MSTTQVLTGAILAMGLFEGSKGVNWRVMFRVRTSRDANPFSQMVLRLYSEFVVFWLPFPLLNEEPFFPFF